MTTAIELEGDGGPEEFHMRLKDAENALLPDAPKPPRSFRFRPDVDPETADEEEPHRSEA